MGFSSTGTAERVVAVVASYLIDSYNVEADQLTVVASSSSNSSVPRLTVPSLWEVDYEIVAPVLAAEKLFQIAENISVDPTGTAKDLQAAFESEGLGMDDDSLYVTQPDIKIVTATTTTRSVTSITETATSRTSTGTSAAPTSTSTTGSSTAGTLTGRSAASTSSPTSTSQFGTISSTATPGTAAPGTTASGAVGDVGDALAHQSLVGSIALTFENPEAVLTGPHSEHVLNAIGQTVAGVVGVPASYVSVWFANARRRGAVVRRFTMTFTSTSHTQTSTSTSTATPITVEYGVDVPVDASADYPDVATMKESMNNVDLSSFTSLLQASIDSEVGDGVYSFVVVGITASAVDVSSTSSVSQTTSMTASSTTTLTITSQTRTISSRVTSFEATSTFWTTTPGSTIFDVSQTSTSQGGVVDDIGDALAQQSLLGSIVLSVRDPEAVLTGPHSEHVLNAIGQTVAGVVGVPASYVSVWFANARRRGAVVRRFTMTFTSTSHTQTSTSTSTATPITVEYGVDAPVDASGDYPDVATMKESMDMWTLARSRRCCRPVLTRKWATACTPLL
ncbi:unnamed protein product [Prorocentrum cordatum]|uniref:Subtilisin n=1 Tax=Prorocentrum cordatum TaxID=2364126 RepID=A0ABN9VYV2_9DINO|nr:unnamed protein product [Polarella glacialis]